MDNLVILNSKQILVVLDVQSFKQTVKPFDTGKMSLFHCDKVFLVHFNEAHVRF